MPRYGVGVDPDCHNTAVGFVVISDVADGERSIQDFGVMLASNRQARKGYRQKTPVEMQIEYLRCMGVRGWGTDVRLAVEAQYYPPRGGKAPPKDIIDLAAVAGAAFGLLGKCHEMLESRLVLPAEWKGTIKKEVAQARICRTFGLEYKQKVGGVDLLTPVRGWDGLKKSQSEVVDALGLALYAARGFQRRDE